MNWMRSILDGIAIAAYFNLFAEFAALYRTRRVRFTGTENKSKLYADPGKHISSFLRGIAMFLLVALINGCLLTLL